MKRHIQLTIYILSTISLSSCASKVTESYYAAGFTENNGATLSVKNGGGEEYYTQISMEYIAGHKTTKKGVKRDKYVLPPGHVEFLVSSYTSASRYKPQYDSYKFSHKLVARHNYVVSPDFKRGSSIIPFMKGRSYYRVTMKDKNTGQVIYPERDE